MRKIPYPKSQVPKKLQIPSSKKRGGHAGLLEFGAWNLCGIWDLEFGISEFAAWQ
jgi:hypothetical protein